MKSYFILLNTSLWYTSFWACIIYFLLFTGLLFFCYKYLLKYISKEKEKVRARHLKILREQEKKLNLEIIRLHNEKFDIESLCKAKELLANAFLTMQRDELFLTLDKDLSDLTKDLILDSVSKGKFGKIQKTIKSNVSTENDWNKLEKDFDLANKIFFHKLSQHWPNLTLLDMRHAAYIRCGLTTKQVETFLNITMRGVQLARQRLRKKMNVPVDTGLNEFIMNLEYLQDPS